ncbi:MAG: thiamine-phosphate kinase [Phycisphaerales bacterium]
MRESELIARIREHNATLGATGGARVLLPPGDDMAMVELAGRRVLVAADQVIEGRHFAPGTPMELVGRKAVARNVSDVAAMAAVPAACVATVALPAGMPDAQVLALGDGLRAAAARWRCPLVGGDIGTHAAAGPLVVSVAILAEPGPTGRVLTRAGARAGDLLCVTGALGGSLEPGGGGRHLLFEPRVEAALALVQSLGARLHAMIDLSDGLGRDAGHLAQEGGLAVEIDAAALPCHPGCDWRRALGDGEDHELAFACEGTPPSEVAGVPVRVVGRFQPADPGQPRVRVRAGATVHRGDTLGWEHAT